MKTRDIMEARARAYQHAQENERRARDLRMMQDPNSWPRWPVLPLVSRVVKFPEPESVGFLLDLAPIQEKHPKPDPMVYLGNIIQISVDRKPLKDLPRKTYGDFEALVAEWRVD